MKLNILFFKILLSDIDILQHQNKYKTAIKYATSKATPRTPTTRRGNRSRPKRFVEAHEILPYDPFFFLRPVSRWRQLVVQPNYRMTSWVKIQCDAAEICVVDQMSDHDQV